MSITSHPKNSTHMPLCEPPMFHFMMCIDTFDVWNLWSESSRAGAWSQHRLKSAYHVQMFFPSHSTGVFWF